MRVLPTGDPNGTGPPPHVDADPAATITVVSVGPYVFTSSRPADQTPAAAGEIASAPTRSVEIGARSAGSKTPSNDGTTLATSTRWVETNVRNNAGSVRSAWVATTSRAPEHNATAISSTDASKLNDAYCNTPTPGAAPKIGPNAATALARPPSVATTPFGVPVDPEV